MKRKRQARLVLFHIVCVCISIIMVYPILWMAFSSFKVTETVIREAAFLLPSKWTIQNYINGWKGFAGISFGNFFRNSLIVASISTIGAVFSSAFVAYGFARIRFWGSKFWFSCMMITLMLPIQIIMVPQFLLYTRLGWIGTYLPLIVPFFCGQAFFIYMDVQFIRGIPKDLDEAAMIDGCSRLQVFLRIMLPLCVPVLCTSAIFSFIWRWEDFLGPFLYLNRPPTYTSSLALKMFADPSSTSDYGAMFAMSTLSVIPASILFVSFQKYLVEGIASSGLKA